MNIGNWALTESRLSYLCSISRPLALVLASNMMPASQVFAFASRHKYDPRYRAGILFVGKWRTGLNLMFRICFIFQPVVPMPPGFALVPTSTLTIFYLSGLAILTHDSDTRSFFALPPVFSLLLTVPA